MTHFLDCFDCTDDLIWLITTPAQLEVRLRPDQQAILLKYRLKPTGISPEEALDELSTMYKVYLQDSKQGVHRLSRVVPLTRRQETILKAINPALLKAQN